MFAGQPRLGRYGEVTKMPTTVHSWISQTGNGGLPGSWDTGVPPAIAATGILTLVGNALNTETVTLWTKTYTFQDVLTDVDGNVHIGADADETIANFVAAVTLGAGAGTKYAASMTLHQTVTASEGAGDTMDVAAKGASRGTSGNTIATTETLANGSFGGATLSGGTEWGPDDIGYIDKNNAGVAWVTGTDWEGVFSGPKLLINSNWNLDIGTDDSPLIAGFSKVTNKGTGTLFLVQTASPPGEFCMKSFMGRTILGKAGSASEYALVMIETGDVVVRGGADTTIYDIWVFLDPSRLEMADSDLVIAGNVHMKGGSAYIVPTIAANKVLEVSGGFVDQLGRVNGSGRISLTRGTLKYRPSGAPTTPDLYVDGGVLDLSKSLIPLTSADFGTTIIGPRGTVIGGALSRDAVWPPSYDFRKEWP